MLGESRIANIKNRIAKLNKAVARSLKKTPRSQEYGKTVSLGIKPVIGQLTLIWLGRGIKPQA